MSNVVANNWKGLEPEIKVAYGKLAAFQQHRLEKEQQQQDVDEDCFPKWENHVKVVQEPQTKPCVLKQALLVPSLIAKDDVVEEIVQAVLADYEDEDNEPQAPPPTPPSPPFWPLEGPATPIADYIRNQRYHQHALEYKASCLPCVQEQPPKKKQRRALCTATEFADLSAVLEQDGRDFFLRALLQHDNDLP